MAEILKEELQTYNQQKDILIGSALGKFVLIHGHKVAGAFDTEQDAIKQGYALFGNIPFLVKQVVEVEIPQNFVSTLLGI